MRTSNFVLLNAKLQCESLLQTGRVKGCEGCELVWLQTRVDESSKGSNVGRVEDDNDVLNLWAILLDVVAELGSNLAVALEEVLTGHTVFTWGTTGRNNILGTSESFSWVNGVSYVYAREGTLLYFVEYAMYTWLIDVVKTNVWG